MESEPPFNHTCDTFFSESEGGNYSPRALFVDMEPAVVDKIRMGSHRQLFHADQMMTGMEVAACNYCRGHYTVGRDFINPVLDKLRLLAERCHNLQGFMIFNSFGGGCGSGFSSLLLAKLHNLYQSKAKITFAVYPSPKVASAVVEPYNAVLTTHDSIDYQDCAFLFDNEALYEICSNSLNIDSPTYSTLNSLISQVVSSITASLRFEGSLNTDLTDLQTNLVPFPRIHFPMSSFAPFMPKGNAGLQSVTVSGLTKECFKASNQMIKCNLDVGKYMACCLLYRGDVVPKDVNKSIQSLKDERALKFVDWCPTGFKMGINYQPATVSSEGPLAQAQRALCALSNTTAIVDAWSRIAYKFDTMYQKRAFVHWYVAIGIDDGEFDVARYDLDVLEKDYNEIGVDPILGTEEY